MRSVKCNAHASGRWLQSESTWSEEARCLLNAAAESLSLSARGYHRVIKVARTIADLDQSNEIAAHHIAEAIRYRPATNQGAEPSPARFTPAVAGDEPVPCV